MSLYLSFPKQLHSDVDEDEGELEIGEQNPILTHPATIGQEAQELAEEEKAKLVSIETYNEEEVEDRKINQLIDDLTKSGDEEEEVPLNVLKRKLRYKHAARKSTHSN
ncbi:hypothetical protein PVK06_017220 [Gossypium arboreum]|uniref:Uncharacterized protein n=1 Tax=Gossypium arboreum TaxID=29729 RepID=A0ABR0Q251_GOSAR|nr:hypothetical protein PVK06_017220 [Gossypium arboreum]